MMIYIGIARHERIQMLGGPTVGVARKCKPVGSGSIPAERAKTETNEADVWDLLEITGPDVCTATRAVCK